MNEQDFKTWREFQKKSLLNNQEFNNLCKDWYQVSVDQKYSYQFDWLGVPIIQYPTDLLAFQDVVFRTKPDLVIECGVARGGSLIFWASMQTICGLKPNVIGIDIDLKPHTLEAVQRSIFGKSIKLIEADSTSDKIHKKLDSYISKQSRVMVVLDSNHTEDHVYQELQIFSRYVTEGNYLLVLDTVIEFLNAEKDRAWGPGNSPFSAVQRFLKETNEFEIDKRYGQFVDLSVAIDGFLQKNNSKRVKLK